MTVKDCCVVIHDSVRMADKDAACLSPVRLMRCVPDRKFFRVQLSDEVLDKQTRQIRQMVHKVQQKSSSVQRSLKNLERRYVSIKTAHAEEGLLILIEVSSRTNARLPSVSAQKLRPPNLYRHVAKVAPYNNNDVTSMRC